jgi:hypothetical protein
MGAALLAVTPWLDVADIGETGAIEFMLADSEGCCEVMPVETREGVLLLGPVSEPEVGRVPAARGSDTS